MEKSIFASFTENNEGLSNTVLSDTLKYMENNGLIFKKDTAYYLTERGLRLNRILYEMAVFGLDELECGEEGDLEIINMFKEYYARLLNVGE